MLTLTHYYWLALAIFLLGINFLEPQNKQKTTGLIFNGICFLGCAEAILVILQYLHVVPSKNPLFATTGSWINPNVTALFLAMSLYSFIKAPINRNKKIFLTALALVLLAIVLLKCRTAYVVALMFIVGRNSDKITTYIKEKFGVKKNVVLLIFLIAFVAFVYFAAFRFKSASTDGRLVVWDNCVGLVAGKPWLGHGFGMFERDYNIFVAQNNLPSNGHVNMPYNDFLELGVEGGVAAILLWCLFMGFTIYFYIANKISPLPLLAFGFVQLVNFGFQAIPAFALFIVYIGTESMGPARGQKNNLNLTARVLPIFNTVLSSICIFVFTHQIRLAFSFHKKETIVKNNPSDEIINELADLEPRLGIYPEFREQWGDSYFNKHLFEQALRQYLSASQTTSIPQIFEKIGYCYQQIRNYDSSAYYFNMAQSIEPYKYAPRMALLKLYQQKGDSLLVRQKAKEILAMPIKVRSEKVEKIRSYAINILNKQP